MTETHTGPLYMWLYHPWPGIKQPQLSVEIVVEASAAAHRCYCTVAISQEWRQRLWLVNEAVGLKGVRARS